MPLLFHVTALALRVVGGRGCRKTEAGWVGREVEADRATDQRLLLVLIHVGTGHRSDILRPSGLVWSGTGLVRRAVLCGLRPRCRQ